MLPRWFQTGKPDGVFVFMNLLLEDRADDWKLVVTIFSDSVLLKTTNGDSVSIVDLESENFYKLCKLYVSWYNEEPGFEHLVF